MNSVVSARGDMYLGYDCGLENAATHVWDDVVRASRPRPSLPFGATFKYELRFQDAWLLLMTDRADELPRPRLVIATRHVPRRADLPAEYERLAAAGIRSAAERRSFITVLALCLVPLGPPGTGKSPERHTCYNFAKQSQLGRINSA